MYEFSPCMVIINIIIITIQHYLPSLLENFYALRTECFQWEILNRLEWGNMKSDGVTCNNIEQRIPSEKES